MKFTLSALKRYLKTTYSAQELGDALTMLGLEIEDVIDPAAKLGEVVVGEIVAVEKHPDSDHMKVLKVAFGDASPVQVVCAAPNVKLGLKGAFAKPGTTLPDGTKLKTVKVRGVESNGMMCSERELGISDEHKGIIELDKSAKVGAPVAPYLNLDVLFVGEITANRPDYLGVQGIARDLAAGGYGEFKGVKMPTIKAKFKSTIKIINEASDVARHFTLREIRGVNNSGSNAELVAYLNGIGAKVISPLVDMTNFMCNDMCRPMHAFDADKIKGDIVLRHAKAGEKFAALDGVEYVLNAGDVVICDDAGIQSLAGVIGGALSACDANTKNVLLESAWFEPAHIRKTARMLGINTDSKFRFERGVDAEFVVPGSDIATSIVLDICGGECGELIESGKSVYKPYTIDFDPAYFVSRIGVEMNANEMKTLLERLYCKVEAGKGVLVITPPSWRADIVAKEDITEELARIIGYDKLPSEPVMPTDFKPVLTAPQRKKSDARRVLASMGYIECYTWSFENSKTAFVGKGVKLLNPIIEELDVMRTSIIPNLLVACRANITKSVRALSLFEIGPVFFGVKPEEQKVYASGVSYGVAGDGAWEIPNIGVKVQDAKAAAWAVLETYNVNVGNLKLSVEKLPDWVNPYASAWIYQGPVRLGLFGEVHPMSVKKFDVKEKVVFFELDLSAIVVKEAKSTAKKALVISEYPSSERDFSMEFADSAKMGEVKAAIVALKNPLITNVKIFDVYKGSMGIRLEIGSMDKTLTDDEINSAVAAAMEAAKKLGGKLRSEFS
ncbi:MAG: phenylalanine--tRNA ligase subunit beta [Alphaproteobacteria bacterium]|nr:phenylalanine--tRNA ligase subunit beta [Alphaproteobacteria bacterium]